MGDTKKTRTTFYCPCDLLARVDAVVERCRAVIPSIQASIRINRNHLLVAWIEAAVERAEQEYADRQHKGGDDD